MKIELNEGKTIIEDAKDCLVETSEGIGCVCNSLLKFNGHIDGTDFYGTIYICECCGNQISVTTKREGIDLELWSEEE